MIFSYSQERRAEVLIAGGRAILASVSLLAVWLEPSAPARYADIAYILLAGYVFYSFAALALFAPSRAIARSVMVAAHTLDLVVAALVMFLTEKSTSPFLTYFVFALASATLRWGLRGAVTTGAAVMASFLALGLLAAVRHERDFQLNRFIIRGGYLVVLTVLLGYIGAHQSRLRRDLSRLASWPRDLPYSAGSVEVAIREATRILGAPKAALVWEEAEEPWIYVGFCSGNSVEVRRERPGGFEPVVAPSLNGADFVCTHSSRSKQHLVFLSPDELTRSPEDPIHPDLRALLGTQSLLSSVLLGETIHGRFFAAGVPRLTTDHLALGRIVAIQLTNHLEQLELLDRLRETAVTQERLKIARDLHDGVVQSLAAAGLKLEAALGTLRTDPRQSEARLSEVQGMLADEQRGLRALSRKMRAAEPALALEPDLPRRVDEVCRRVSAQWDLAVDFSCGISTGPVTQSLAHETCRMVYEALVNAARHGRARTARVELRGTPGGISLTVDDNGKGFPFQGEFDLKALTTRQLGPYALLQRVTALGGSLRLASSRRGARLEIGIPLASGIA